MLFCFYSIFVGFVSLSITFFNKAVFSMYAFNYSNALTAAQMILSLLVIIMISVQAD